MLWQAEHGATAAEYRKTQEERGAPIPDYLNPPPALPGVAEWFQTYWELSTERRFMGGPIPWSAIAAFPTDDPDTFRACIRAADAAYLNFKPEPPMEPLRPGVLKGKS